MNPQTFHDIMLYLELDADDFTLDEKTLRHEVGLEITLTPLTVVKPPLVLTTEERERVRRAVILIILSLLIKAAKRLCNTLENTNHEDTYKIGELTSLRRLEFITKKISKISKE